MRILKEQVNKYFFNKSEAGKENTEYPTMYSVENKKNADALIYIRIQDRIKTAKNVIVSNMKKLNGLTREIEKYEVEIYKKYAIPAACIVFLLIGAPLGYNGEKRWIWCCSKYQFVLLS